MVSKIALAAAPLILGQIVLGGIIDGMEALNQTVLWLALQLASLGGAGVGLAVASPLADSRRERVLMVVAMLFAWRVSYFPVMVFSGHVASIGEWLLVLAGLPIFVYPIFLLSVTVLHAAAAALAACLVSPPRPIIRWVGAAAFFIASCVSFSKPIDLLPLPDMTWTLDGEAVPPMRAERGNPYLSAVTASGYWPHQRVVLVAAALTYDTIPPSPWATTVKSVLEVLFEAKPQASSQDRVREHHLAYHSAHPIIGCRSLERCPAFVPEPR